MWQAILILINQDKHIKRVEVFASAPLNSCLMPSQINTFFP
jgi:hypothetical protein